MATASDDGSVHVFHSKVYDDFVTNPLLVPVKKLKKNEEKERKRAALEKKLREAERNGEEIQEFVPVPRVTGHSVTREGLGVLDCVWHPTQAWVFSAGADGRCYMWV